MAVLCVKRLSKCHIELKEQRIESVQQVGH